MPYLTKEELEAIFADPLAVSGGAFWSRVSEDVDWTIMGSGPGSGRYTNLADLRANTIDKLAGVLEGPPEIKLVNVFFGGENYEWTSLEMEARATRKSGMHLILNVGDGSLLGIGKPYYNRYCLVVRWNDEGKVVQVRDYLDMTVIAEVWKEAEELGLF
ncbi:hypothetical protein ACJ41O_010916 [Fusarium nematophilum]